MIIFAYGENTFLSSRHVGAMRIRFKEKFDSSGMNLSEFDGKLEIGPIAQAVQSPGFLSEKRMVIVRGLLTQITRKPDAKPWVEQLQKTPDESILVLLDTVSVKKVEKNEIFKQLSKAKDFHAYPFPLLEGSNLIQWADQECKRIKLNIDRSKLNHVVGLVGSDLWQLSGELKKLKAYAQDQSVTDEMIELLVKANFEDQMFAFVGAVANKNSTQALKLLDEQRQSGSTDFHLFAMLARQIRLLIGARDVLERNPSATKQEVASDLSVHPFVAQKVLAQARAFEQDQLKELHELLFNLDRKIKTGGATIEIAVDRVVAKMVIQT